MSHRIQITLDDPMWEFLQTIPKGERSNLLKQAVSDELIRRRRRQAADDMDEIRKNLKPLPGSLEQWLREERDGRPSPDRS